jgi:hypothetical protein
MRRVCDVTASIRAASADGQGFVLEVTAITKTQSNTLPKKEKRTTTKKKRKKKRFFISFVCFFSRN